MDVHDKETRSYNMSCIKGKNTKPEEIVRKYLFSQGFRYRKNDGNDHIYDQFDNNTLVFEDLMPEDLLVEYPTNSNDVVIRIRSTNETITISNFRDKEVYSNFKFVFKDNIVFNDKKVMKAEYSCFF